MATLVSITVSPDSPYILINGTQSFSAVAVYSDSSTIDITNNTATTWISSLTSVATVSNTSPKGIATAQTISGSTLISATYGGMTGSAILRVGLANYTRTYEQLVEAVKITETSLNAAHNPIARMTAPNFSMFNGGVSMRNQTGTSGGVSIGWTLASGHPGDYEKAYIANEQQQDGYWVQLNVSGAATISFSSSQRNLGVVSSVSVDSTGTQLTSGGNIVLVQIAGEAYVFTTDGTITRGSFLTYDTNGKVKLTAFVPASPTPILGFALENFAATYPNMVKMRIQICGE